jgi:hypothetical protein
MSSLTVGLITAGSVFSGALLGMGLRRLLPGHHLSKETQEVVKLSTGTIATLTALVLGLLVSSAAVFLVLELNRPLDGVVKISSAPLRNALQHLGQ